MKRILGMIGAAVLPSLVLATFLFTSLDLAGIKVQAAPFAYSQRLYPAEPPEVCPGESFHYETVATVNRVPVQVRVVITVFGIDQNRTVDQVTVEYFNWFEVGELSPKTRVITTGVNWPSGAYEVRATADSADSQVEWYRVPFRIKAGAACLK